MSADRSGKSEAAGPHHEHPAKDAPPPAEEGLAEEALVEPEPGALELPAQLVEDVTGEGIGEDVAEDILLAIAESGVSGGEAGLAEGVVLAALLGIDQDGVRLADCLAPVPRLPGAPIAGGGVLEGEAAVGPLAFLGGCTGADRQ